MAGATENLSQTNGSGQGVAGGLSVVERFRSPAGARSEFADDLPSFKSQGSGSVVTFPVPGIPNAHGFGGGGPGGVSFVDGDYYYLVGEGVAPTSAANQALVASAQRLYRRVHA